MKILFPYMARWKAVNWTRYHSLLTCLAEQGHEVFVLQPPSLDLKETNFTEVQVDLPKNLTLIDVEIPDWLWSMKIPLEKLIKKGLYSLFSWSVARRVIRDHDIDVLFLYNIPQYPYLALPVRTLVFDYADDYVAMLAHELGQFQNPVTMAVGKGILSSMVSKVNHVFAVSNVLGTKFGARVRVLPNGVDLRKVEHALTHPMKMTLRRPVIGFIGAFEYFIDFDLMLNVAEALPEATFLLVGSGRLWNYVKEQCDVRGIQNIILTGGVKHQDVFRYIALMDVCLNIFKKIPISHGASPIKLFEYLAMHKPVVSTRLDELKHIDKGFLMYGDDPAEVVERITALLDDSSLRDKVAGLGYRETLERYNWSSIAKEFTRVVTRGG